MTDDSNEQDGCESLDALLREVARANPRALSDPQALVGKQLGNFAIEATLGAGGMGVVYRATDRKLRRAVAIKVLPEAYVGDDERRRRLLREARAAAAMSHPNLATIHDVGEVEGRIFIVMELVDGVALREKLRSGALDPSEARHIAREIARGLSHAHKKGIVHRDLKPENVMISSDGVIKVLDFGLAKVREIDAVPDGVTASATATKDGHVVGTPAYMSPEQAAGRAVDARSDLFSLGVVLYEMTTGTRPFEGDTTPAVIAATLRDEPREPSERRAGIDPSLARVTMRCLRKEPDERFGSANELILALDSGSSDQRQGRRRSMRLPFAGVFGLAGAAALLAMQTRSPDVEVNQAGPRTSASAVVEPTTLANLPPPPTAIPEAASEYAAGMQAFHDDNWGRALEHFDRAATLDPTMAAAHMRVAMTATASENPEKKRGAYAKAAALRTQLTERDRALLEALEPRLQFTQPSPALMIQRLEALARRYPYDAEIYMWLALASYGTPAALVPATRAIELDPNDAQSWETRGVALLVAGKAEEARAALEHSASIAVAAADAYSWIGLAEEVDGRCVEMERALRSFADRSPFPGLFWLLGARVAMQRSPETVRETITQALAASPEPRRALFAAQIESQLALVAGDFKRVATLVDKEARALAADTSARNEYGPHYGLAMRLVLSRLESGDVAGARAAAHDFTSGQSSWTREDPIGHDVDMTLFLARIARGTADGMDAERRAWVDAHVELGAHRGHLWTYGYAAAALTEAEAKNALETLAEYGPLSPAVPKNRIPPATDYGIPDAEAGRVFLLAGRPDEAIPYLRRAVAHCGVFLSPVAHVHAALDLGRALELKGDAARACEAYAEVLERFGNANPRSVSADAARARRASLACDRR